MDKTMGNQQETTSITKFAWLGGIIDGEGSIGVTRMMSHRKNPTYTARVSVGNTNMAIISEICKILDLIGITGHLEKRQRSVKNNDKNWKDAIVIQISNIKGVKCLLDTIFPYLIGKKAHAELVLRFINSRLKNYELKDRKIGSPGPGCPYSKEELNLCEQLKELNKKGIR